MIKTRAAIPGFNGYEVDRQGTVWSRWKRVGSPRNGTAGFAIRGDWRPLKGIRKQNGYVCVNLKGPSGLVRNLTVHSLVLLAFVGPAPDGYECRHLDGNRSNNKYSNLKWGTGSENSADKIPHGTSLRGERHHQAKASESQVVEIRTLAASGYSNRQLSAKFGFGVGMIQAIVSRRTWRHI